MIEKPPFTRITLEEEKNPNDYTFTLRLNQEEREMLKDAKRILRQEKDGTALKQLARIGYICVTQPLNRQIFDTVFENERRNKRIGIMAVE